jgi:hypothetical protein
VNSFVAASGDDVVCWVDPKMVSSVVASVMRYTARDKKPQSIGLAQCVTEVKTGKYYDVDFCSKWSFVLDENDINTWTMTRDYSK